MPEHARSRKEQRPHRAPRTSHATRFAVIGTSIVIVFVVAWATYITATTTVVTIEVSGSYHSGVETVVSMSGVQTGDTLFVLDPGLLADRIEQHSWIEEANVTRWPTGTMTIDVVERVPVALVIGGNGIPLSYLDAEGTKLPLDSLARYDVPLLRGVPVARNRAARIDDEDALELLEVLADLEPESNDLISEIVVSHDGADLEVTTVPLPLKKCVRVRLGRGDYDKKFAKLTAFWNQAVVGHAEKNIEWIDLRFEGQVVTKET